MNYGPTVDFVSGGLVACYRKNCEIYQDGSWEYLQDTTAWRQEHSSVATEDGQVLLIGYGSKTTEWIQVNTSAAQREPFTVRHGQQHCTIETSADVIVVTGGVDNLDYVTEYQLKDGTQTVLTPMEQPRQNHACGTYLDANDQQVRV